MDSPELIGRLQHRLVACGYLTGDFRFGIYDRKTDEAVTAAITWERKQ